MDSHCLRSEPRRLLALTLFAANGECVPVPITALDHNMDLLTDCCAVEQGKAQSAQNIHPRDGMLITIKEEDSHNPQSCEASDLRELTYFFSGCRIRDSQFFP